MSVVRRIDPEQPKPLQHIWRKLYCTQAMPKIDGLHDSSETIGIKVIDSGYCLDRYSLIDSLYKD